MFTLDKDVRLKKDIISVLDTLDEPVPIKKLRDMIGYSNAGKILLMCMELQAIIESIYKDGQVHLLIETAGITLKRHSSSLQYLYEHIFSSSMSYQIISALIQKNSISTYDFSIEQGISFSTLRRKIVEINEAIQKYDLHITISDHLFYMRPNYVQNICMAFLYLFSVHRQLGSIPWIPRRDKSLIVTRQIFQYLDMKLHPLQIETFSILIYLITQFHATSRSLVFTPMQQEIINSLLSPEKPDFLKAWPEADWKFVIMLLYSSRLYDFHAEYTPSTAGTFYDGFSNYVSIWIQAFEKHFAKLDAGKIRLATENLHKQFVAYSFLRITDDIISQLNVFDMDTFKASNKNYYAHFKAFWKELEDKAAKPSTISKISCLLLCIRLVPFEEILPSVRIYLFSDLTDLINSYHKVRIKSLLQRYFKVEYTDDYLSADVVLATSPLPDYIARMIPDRYLLFRPGIYKHDLLDIIDFIYSRSDHKEYPLE